MRVWIRLLTKSIRAPGWSYRRGGCELAVARLVVAGADGEADAADAGRVAGGEDVGEVLVAQAGVGPDDDALLAVAGTGLGEELGEGFKGVLGPRHLDPVRSEDGQVEVFRG